MKRATKPRRTSHWLRDPALVASSLQVPRRRFPGFAATMFQTSASLLEGALAASPPLSCCDTDALALVTLANLRPLLGLPRPHLCAEFFQAAAMMRFSFFVSALLAVLQSTEAATEPLTDSNIQAATNLWISNSLTATAQYGVITGWDTSNITSMVQLLFHKQSFNEDISKWDAASVTDTRRVLCCCCSPALMFCWLALTLDSPSSHSDMFNNAKEFNQALGSWDVAKVTTTK